MKFLMHMAVICLSVSASYAFAETIKIDFDHARDGSVLTAPPYFSESNPLAMEFNDQGVIFSGPSQKDSGSILNQAGNFGVNAVSGVNFLAFNSTVKMANGGIPRGPLTITFVDPASVISLYVAGGNATVTFTMTAYGMNDEVIETSTVTTQAFAVLKVDAFGGAKKVVVKGEGASYFVMDDLEFTSPPVFF